MRAAIIKGGTVVNIVAASHRMQGVVYLDDLPVRIGDTYDGADFYRDGIKVEVPNPLADEYAEALNLLGVETEEKDEPNNA